MAISVGRLFQSMMIGWGGGGGGTGEGVGGGRICNNQFCNVGQDIEVDGYILGVFWLAWSAGAVLCVHSGEVVIHKHD